MEKNRSLVFRILVGSLVLGVAAVILIGLTGVLRDPAVETAVQAERASVAERPPTPSPSPPAEVARPEEKGDGGTGTVAQGEEKEAFPQFDDEPTGS